MILSFSLAQDISCELLCNKIQKAVISFTEKGHNLSDYQLVIDFKPIINSEQSLLPKLEYKGNSSDSLS